MNQTCCELDLQYILNLKTQETINKHTQNNSKTAIRTIKTCKILFDMCCFNCAIVHPAERKISKAMTSISHSKRICLNTYKSLFNAFS